MTPVTPVYRWIQFDRCEECGVDAGARCMDENDNPAVHPCLGRVRRTGAVREGHFCRHGHRVEGANARVKRSGYAECRECHNNSARESMRRHRATKNEKHE